METVEYKNISFTVWDVGGQDKVCRCSSLWMLNLSIRYWDVLTSSLLCFFMSVNRALLFLSFSLLKQVFWLLCGFSFPSFLFIFYYYQWRGFALIFGVY